MARNGFLPIHLLDKGDCISGFKLFKDLEEIVLAELFVIGKVENVESKLFPHDGSTSHKIFDQPYKSSKLLSHDDPVVRIKE